jgi:hypothetical protein
VWTPALTTTGARLAGTVIGQRQLWQLGSTAAEKLALVIDSARDVPAIAGLAVMTAPGGGDTDAGASVPGYDGTLCSLPVTPLITDFAYVAPDGGAPNITDVHFGSGYGVLSGGGYLYPTTGMYALAPDLSQSTWHIVGTVRDYSGFGLYFNDCNRIDASKYKGISFKVSGTLGASGAPAGDLTLLVGTLNDSLAPVWINTHGGNSTSGGTPFSVGSAE